MKWHRFLLTITTVISISLPNYAFSEECDEETWNQALNYQKKADVWYNAQALKFNDFLKSHKEHVFLHQEFNARELEALWNPRKRSLQKKINLQVRSSQLVITLLNDQADQINEESEIVESALNRWQRISQLCQNEHKIANAISSLNYVKSNQDLKIELAQLLGKIDLVKRIYQNEVDILNWTRNAH